MNYEVYSPYGFHANGTVPPFSYSSVTLNSVLAVYSTTERNKGIWVRATDPSKAILVSGINYQEATTNAFLALPTGPMTTEYRYIASSMLMDTDISYYPSLILIVGTQNCTKLTITPTQYVHIPNDLIAPNNSQNFANPGESYTVTLNRLQTYQIESRLDLTGSQIVSNKPLSVFAGHRCANVPHGIRTCDHLFEQIPPTSTWGRHFLLIPSDSVSRISPEWYRVVSSKPFTTVLMTCYLLADSQSSPTTQTYNITDVGGFKEFQVDRNKYCYLLADEPVLVMQYAYGASANSNNWGDPFMMMVIPIEEYVTNSSISFYAYEDFITGITIVMLQQDLPTSCDIQLDNVSVVSNWTRLYCSKENLCGYTTHMQVAVGFHTVRHTKRSIPVAVHVYGFESGQSYGYPAAVALQSKNVLSYCSYMPVV